MGGANPRVSEPVLLALFSEVVECQGAVASSNRCLLSDRGKLGSLMVFSKSHQDLPVVLTEFSSRWRKVLLKIRIVAVRAMEGSCPTLKSCVSRETRKQVLVEMPRARSIARQFLDLVQTGRMLCLFNSPTNVVWFQGITFPSCPLNCPSSFLPNFRGCALNGRQQLHPLLFSIFGIN